MWNVILSLWVEKTSDWEENTSNEQQPKIDIGWFTQYGVCVGPTTINTNLSQNIKGRMRKAKNTNKILVGNFHLEGVEVDRTVN
jgi:hypothetical protein